MEFDKLFSERRIPSDDIPRALQPGEQISAILFLAYTIDRPDEKLKAPTVTTIRMLRLQTELPCAIIFPG